ncbi:hypothetical protein BDA96_08G119200 [Sorghum bicolor]|uniref:Uncharacterized protein n=2 Tax=Sorghum bicolor TaxID=4558 RepID=A0A921QFJ8_SORBI|nr:hypothetical protein BDA96_08G119200 [Sorghum bicolor]KXG28463.1 hypothetical protein SORBI_3005G125800 [Sorghum bicolor]
MQQQSSFLSSSCPPATANPNGPSLHCAALSPSRSARSGGVVVGEEADGSNMDRIRRRMT